MKLRTYENSTFNLDYVASVVRMGPGTTDVYLAGGQRVRLYHTPAYVITGDLNIYARQQQEQSA